MGGMREDDRKTNARCSATRLIEDLCRSNSVTSNSVTSAALDLTK
jgi:hypothetical protein